MKQKISLSIVIPVFNEEDNIHPMYERSSNTLKNLDHDFEIIFVNDGSDDTSKKKLDAIAIQDDHVKIIHFRRNFGQTAALMAGIDAAKGDILIPMDGDLQNDPSDIPRLLAKLDEGYDVVSGWRKDRQDKPIKRTLPSKAANWLISKISGIHLHDYGCTLKAYKKGVIKDVRLYGEMHRFIPIYAYWQGGKVTEIPVMHHPRIHGQSKYGLKRTIKVILDLILVKFIEKYSQRPMYIFGGFGLFSLLFSFLCFALMLYLKYFNNKSFIQTPLPMLVVLLFLVGFMCILMGFIAEMLMRTYFESQGKSTYLVDYTCNFEDK